jgi:hypothetical protein
MGTGITCTVWADGQRLADGAPTDDPYAPTVLDGLKIAWGRETTVDQPDASSCTFDLMDELGGQSFMNRLRTGTPIDVTATGWIYPDPDQPVWPDPSFEAGLPGTTATNARVAHTARRASSGTYALRMDPVDAARRASTRIAPAPFAAPGTDPDAWDEIPTTSPGQTWSYGASVWAPPGASVTVRPVLYAGPYAAAARVVSTSQRTVQGTGTWAVVTGEFVPDTAGAWVGLEVSVFPTGVAWDDVPDDVTWDSLADTAWADWQWDDFGAVFVDDVTVLAPAEGTEQTVLVFSGRVASLAAGWDDGPDCPTVAVACVDFTADLQNRDVGDEPWAVETMASRFNRVLDLAGMDVTAEIADSVAGILVTWVDVDNQAATGLLADLASSVDAVMWSATHQVSGPYLEVEDPAQRPSLYFLELVDGVVVIVRNPDDVAAALDLSACDLLRDDVTWTQDTQDVITRAAVTWQEQGVDDEGQPATTEHTVTLINTELEAQLGSRRLSLTTQLQAEDDATDVAQKLLARTSVSDWRATGLVIDDAELDDPDDEDVARVLTLLDGTQRNGLPMRIVDLPAWTPAGDTVPVYLEGGTYSFDDGAWVLDLTVSNATAQGQSVAWDELPDDPAWSWDDFDPDITWDDLRGVGVATEGA